MVIAVVICAVVVSLLWVVVIFIYKKKRQARALRYHQQDIADEEKLNHCYPTHLTSSHLIQTHPICTTDTIHNVTPLLTSSSGDGYATILTGHDSGSEHSSGKDSGVGDSAQRSNEDLQPNCDLSRPGMRRSLILYSEPHTARITRGKYVIFINLLIQLLVNLHNLMNIILSTFMQILFNKLVYLM